MDMDIVKEMQKQKEEMKESGLSVSFVCLQLSY